MPAAGTEQAACMFAQVIQAQMRMFSISLLRRPQMSAREKVA